MSIVRASAAAFGALALALSFIAPASAGPLAPRPAHEAGGGAVRVQYFGYDDEYRVVRPNRVYGRRAYADEIFEDEDPRYYRERRIPAARERARRYERRAYGRDSYFGQDDDFYEPEADAPPRRLAGPPSTLGAGEGRRTFDPKFARAVVPYQGSEPANSIVINTRTRYLYFVQGDGTAIRYGVGVGKEGFTWKGVQKISAKREWPNWHPPAEMRVRRPELPVMMAGGPDNPLGARALYLGNTLYRIHGSNEPWTIGRAVSSGCIRMTNDDVTDLYDRVGIGTSVKVL